ncbi:ATP-binding protein, partial [Streptomyces sp. SID11385]|uniref:ATP-binding protein n=1 Tax=Streptomyces sp. SID11385 TaxID=2706031 RepID=UPI0013C62E26
PVSALVAVLAAAAWLGRDRGPAPEESGPSEEQAARLASLYEALVPYFSVPEAPDPLYAHGGEWQRVLGDPVFDEHGRLAALTVTYPAYFTDGDPESRARVERLLHAKCGRGREYHFAWDEEANRLTLTALSPLPTDIPAQPFVTSPGEVVLGLTDALAVRRTVPLVDARGTALDVPPVVWRTGTRSPEPHLLVVGRPGSGTSTLLRAVALQALRGGDVLVVDGGGTGDYTCFVGRDGVLGVECGLTGALGSLEWAARETERRLLAANRARQAGEAPPEDVRRPLWVL